MVGEVEHDAEAVAAVMKPERGGELDRIPAAGAWRGPFGPREDVVLVQLLTGDRGEQAKTPFCLRASQPEPEPDAGTRAGVSHAIPGEGTPGPAGRSYRS